MDPKNDIRQQMDPCDEKASWVLQMQQPQRTLATDVGWDTNGLDCFVAVIRRMYAFTPQTFLGDEAFAAEEKNPILRYAWQMLDIPGSATDETRAQQAAEKQAVMSKLFSGKHNVPTRFHDLMELMVDAVWSRPELLLFHPLMQQLRGDPAWRLATCTPRQIAALSLIVLDCVQYPGMSLQQAVDSMFGVRGWQDEDTLFVCKRPNIVRVMYYSSPDEPSRSFEELRTFDMPFTRVEGTSLFPDGRSRYALIAIVRIRGPGLGEDSARLYEVDGCNSNILTDNPAFHDSEWSVGHPSSNMYAMFFGNAGNDCLEACPEVSPNAGESDKFGNLVGMDMEQVLHQIRLAYQTN